MSENPTKKKEQFIKRLKKVCKKCKDSSIDAYYRNIRRLFKLDNDSDVPSQSVDWIRKKSLVSAYEKQPLKARRHLSVAAVKFLQMLDKNTKDWFQRMVADTEAYEKNRAKNKKSPTEKENWPKGGWHASARQQTTL